MSDSDAGQAAAKRSHVRHWYIMDWSLLDDYGHPANHALAITREMQRRATKVSVYAADAVKQDRLPRLRVKPWFRLGAFTFDPVNGDHQDYIARNQATAQDLARIGSSAFHHDDMVLFPTVTFNEFHGIIRWAVSLPPRNRPRIVVVLMVPPDWEPVPRMVKNGATYYRRALADRSAGIEINFCVETEEMAQIYAPILGVTPTVLPMPVGGLERASAERGAALACRGPDEILISCLGHTRREKGFHLLPEVAMLIGQGERRHKFFVQACHHDEVMFLAAERKLASLPSVHIHRSTLGRDDYLSLLLASDLVVLPYDPTIYHLRGSGIFFEAVMSGTPVVVPASTWMAREIAAAGNGVAFDAFSAPAIAASLRRAIELLPDLRERAKQVARETRRHHGAAAYVDKIISLATPG